MQNFYQKLLLSFFFCKNMTEIYKIAYIFNTSFAFGWAKRNNAVDKVYLACTILSGK